MSVDHPVPLASERREPAAGQSSYTVPAPVQATRRVRMDVEALSAPRRSEEEYRENSGNRGDRGRTCLKIANRGHGPPRGDDNLLIFEDCNFCFIARTL